MNVLLIEDNKGDQMIMREAFEEARVECNLNVVNDGIEGLSFLQREGSCRNASCTDIILLDLNLPKKTGQEVLKDIKNTRGLEHIPIIIVSNSRSDKDICECYTLGASAYVSKPSGFEGFVSLARTMKVFWMDLVCYCSPQHHAKKYKETAT